MKLLIIGKTGQVGASLVQLASQNKIDFMATDRAQIDITDRSQINNFFELQHHFNFVINASAYTNVDGAEDNPELATAVNADGAQYLAQACKKYNIPLIHLSTDYVFDGAKLTDYAESDLPNPLGVYGQSKLAGELNLQNTWEKHIILRVSWVFSAYGKNFVKTISRLCDEKETLGVIANQYGSPTSARNIAQAILTICKKIHDEKIHAWGIYHYADFPNTNWHQLASYVARIKNATTEIFAIEEKDYPLKAKRPQNSRFCTHKIKKVFGVEQGFWMPEIERVLQ